MAALSRPFGDSSLQVTITNKEIFTQNSNQYLKSVYLSAMDARSTKQRSIEVRRGRSQVKVGGTIGKRERNEYFIAKKVAL